MRAKGFNHTMFRAQTYSNEMLPASSSTEFLKVEIIKFIGIEYNVLEYASGMAALLHPLLPSWINLRLFRSSRPSENVPFMNIQIHMLQVCKRLSMKKLHMRCRVMPPAFFSLPEISRHMPQGAWRLPKCLGRHVFDVCSLPPLCVNLCCKLHA